MDPAPETVSLGASLLVMATMFGAYAIMRFHAKQARGRAKMLESVGEDGQDFYRRMIALRLMAAREQFEAEERDQREQMPDIAIDLTAGTEQLYDEAADARSDETRGSSS